MGNSFKSANFLMESRLADAARGDADALYDLGMAAGNGSTPRRLTCATDKNHSSKQYFLSDIVGITDVASTPFGVKALGIGLKTRCFFARSFALMHKDVF